MIFEALVLLFAVTFIILWVYARWNFGTLEKMGIPVVEYSNPILGNARDLYEKPGGLEDVKWTEKYGPIFGVYDGRLPQVFIGVPDLVREICVKDSAHFLTKRRDVDLGNKIVNETIDFLSYEKWKIVRRFSTPLFSSAKLKLMNLPINQTAKDFVSDLTKRIESSSNKIAENVAIDMELHTMVTDLVARSLFSVKISGNERHSSENELAKIVHQMLNPPESKCPWLNHQLTIYARAFPFLQKLAAPSWTTTDKFVLIFKQLLKERQQSGDNYNDVIDTIIECLDKLDTEEYKEAGMKELTLFAQALIFFSASQDQISTMISTLIFHLLEDSELEEKVLKEIDSLFDKVGQAKDIKPEHLSELELTNACLQECLRLYAVFHRTERLCTKDWENKEYGLKFKKGTLVIIPIWGMNRNPEFNENAGLFKPERFLAKNKDKLNPFSTTGFGYGLRICTGKAFALQAMPVIVAHLLKEFKFRKRENTKLEFVPGGPLFQPHEPIYVDVSKRK